VPVDSALPQSSRSLAIKYQRRQSPSMSALVKQVRLALLALLDHPAPKVKKAQQVTKAQQVKLAHRGHRAQPDQQDQRAIKAHPAQPFAHLGQSSAS
jgi:hypothetical protein